MSHCASCGAEVTSGARYCTGCGAPVEGWPGGGSVQTRRLSAETLATQEQGLLVALRQATLGEYEILGEIGRGGMAVVYLAHDLALDRKVAIKVMSPALMMMDPGVRERFKREARTAAALSHPHIIPVFAVRESADLVYFVMKFIVGRSLESVIKEVGAMPIPVVQTVLGQVGSALGHAHKHGVVHRDMKPGNVMLDEDGWVVVTDFGIAKVADAEALTQTGGMVGTPAYMSPEQCAGGQVTGASDQYSLAVMAYEMITGRQPFSGGTLVNLIYDHCHTPPPPLLDLRPDCPPPIAAAVMRMLEKDPANRWPTVEDAVTAVGVASETQGEDVKTQILTFVQSGGTSGLLDKFRTPGSPVPLTGALRQASAARSQVPAAGAGPPALAPERKPRGSPLIWAVPLVTAVALGGVWMALRSRGREAPAAGATTTAPPAGSAIARLELAPLAVSLAPGDRATVHATGRDAAGGVVADVAVSWESSNPQVATVSPGGLVLAVGPGVAELTARSGASSAAALVTVTAPSAAATRVPRPAAGAATITVEPAAATLVAGETVRLKAVARDPSGAVVPLGAVRWSTRDSGVARISPEGLVTGLAAGTARIEGEVEGRTAAAVVSVTAATLASVDVSPAKATVPVGGSLPLRATPHDRSGRQLADRAVSWQSTNPQVAAVSVDGVVSGIRPGTATIDATSGGVSGSASVTVEAAPVAAQPSDPRPEIERVLESYRRAIESRDLAQLKAAYSGLTGDQERAWRAFFGNVTELTATLKIEDLQVSEGRAQARVAGTYEFRSGTRQTQHVEFVAAFERGPAGWRLVTVK